MYHRGTLQQFNTWHTAAKLAYGIPAQGIIGKVNGQDAPDNQRTVAYVDAIQNPNKSDDYVWLYGAYPDSNLTVVSQEAYSNSDWFNGN